MNPKDFSKIITVFLRPKQRHVWLKSHNFNRLMKPCPCESLMCENDYRRCRRRGVGTHEEGRMILNGGRLRYSQASVPATWFIFVPNKVEQNILCSRLQFGHLWMGMKPTMYLRIWWEGKRGTDLSPFLFSNS